MMGRMSGAFYIRGAWEGLEYARRRGLTGSVRRFRSLFVYHILQYTAFHGAPCPFSYLKDYLIPTEIIPTIHTLQSRSPAFAIQSYRPPSAFHAPTLRMNTFIMPSILCSPASVSCC